MPPIRYGPDITDDAARVLNELQDINKARKLRDRGKLKPATKAQRLREQKVIRQASKLFGVSEKNIQAGKFGLIRDLAKYGYGGKDSRGRLYKGKRLAKRNRVVADKRGRKRTKRGVAGESIIKASGRMAANDGTERRAVRSDKEFGGASQLGFTVPKGLLKAYAKFDRVQKRRGNKPLRTNLTTDRKPRSIGAVRPQFVPRGRRFVPGGGAEDINRGMGDSKRRGQGILVRGAARPKKPSKPKAPKASKASKRAKTQANKRKKAVQSAGKKNKSTAKGSRNRNLSSKKSPAKKKKSPAKAKKSPAKKRKR